MSWLIEIDGDTCIGSGMCVGFAPDHFEFVDGFTCVKKAQVCEPPLRPILLNL